MARGGIEYEHKKNIKEVMLDIKNGYQPWKWKNLFTTRGECFYKVRRDGTIRLYRTGEKIGFCWADMRITPVRGGESAMILKTAAGAGMKLGAWMLCVICLFMVAHDWVEYGSAMVVRDIPYLLLAALVVLLSVMTGQETPKLIGLIEKDLGWRRAR